jgi:hypothetical protein
MILYSHLVDETCDEEESTEGTSSSDESSSDDSSADELSDEAPSNEEPAKEESSDEESPSWETSDDDSDPSSNLHAGFAYDSYSSDGSERGFHSIGGYNFFNGFQLPDGMNPFNL